MGDSMTSSRSHGKIKPGIIGLGIMLVLVLLVSGCTQPAATPAGTPTPTATQTSVGMANPASVSCGQAGGTVEIKKDATGNEYGMCTFKNGDFLRGVGTLPGRGMQTRCNCNTNGRGKEDGHIHRSR